MGNSAFRDEYIVNSVDATINTTRQYNFYIYSWASNPKYEVKSFKLTSDYLKNIMLTPNEIDEKTTTTNNIPLDFTLIYCNNVFKIQNLENLHPIKSKIMKVSNIDNDESYFNYISNNKRFKKRRNATCEILIISECGYKMDKITPFVDNETSSKHYNGSIFDCDFVLQNNYKTTIVDSPSVLVLRNLSIKTNKITYFIMSDIKRIDLVDRNKIHQLLTSEAYKFYISLLLIKEHALKYNLKKLAILNLQIITYNQARIISHLVFEKTDIDIRIIKQRKNHVQLL
jgi:hypothetical protein